MIKNNRVTFWVTNGIVLTSAAVSVVAAVKNDVIPQQWFAVLIFVSLFAVLLGTQRVPEILAGLRKIEKEIIEIDYQRFEYHNDLFLHLSTTLRSARKEILVTHLRETPPYYRTTEKKYYDEVIKWAQDNTHGVVKRVTSDCNSELAGWCSIMAKESESTSNFIFRCLPWSPNAPTMNYAIIDRTHLYLVLPGDEGNVTSGLYLGDKKSAGMFANHFDRLWANSNSFASSSTANPVPLTD